MHYAALCALVAGCAGLAAADLSAVDAVRATFYLTEELLWRNVTDRGWNEHAELGADVELIKEFKKLDAEIRSIPRAGKLESGQSWLWTKAREKVQKIDGMYKEFLNFANAQAAPGGVPAPVKKWLDLAEHVLIDPEVSVVHAVNKLSELLEHGDLFRAALQEEQRDLCNLQISPHQLIYDMYNTISLTEIKGYAMMQFSWMLLRIYGKGNFTQEANLTRQRYGERAAKTASAARAALSMARRDLYRCNPQHHKEGETFAQVTRLLQGYIENEVDMNTDGTCRENCAYYTLAENHGCFKNLYCSKQPQCKGRIINCQYIDSDMWVCPGTNSSNRRYDWIEYENGRSLGRVSSCTQKTEKVDSWWRWLFWHCSYCMCLCDEISPDSHRYFSLMDTVSDVKNNKVVTGVRLIKIKRVFHLQISEGTLSERGTVTPGDWVAVMRFDPADRDRIVGLDYHMLTYEKRAIDLDELDSPKGYVLTGVRFSMIGAHLHFEIRSTPFNYTTGRLIPERTRWISNDNTEGTEKPRSRLQLYRPDIPTRGNDPDPVDSSHDQFVEFTNTDFEADAAQSTVPFIDIQPVQPLKGASLVSGAGIIHRGSRGSGGFLAVKLVTYDYARHVLAEPPRGHYDDAGPDFTPAIN